MYAKFYKTPTVENNDYTELFLFATDRIINYEYTKRWTDVGDFQMVLPFGSVDLGKIKLNYLIEFYGDWLIIENIKHDNMQITLSGYDCKRLAQLRISTFGNSTVAGTEGYDVVRGTTSECIKHYFDNNIIHPADSERAMPIIWHSETEGLEQDSYMARLESIADITKTLCDNAGIGYDITNHAMRGLRVELKNSVDRSIFQYDNPIVIFGYSRYNVKMLEFEHDESNLLNAIYATGADVTQTVYRDDVVPKGILRRETAIDVSVDTVADIKQYALYDVEENVETHTYSLDISVNAGYGEKFNIGDIVTVQETGVGRYNFYSAVITEVKRSISAGNESISITLGKQKPKLLNCILNNLLNDIRKRRLTL